MRRERPLAHRPPGTAVIRPRSDTSATGSSPRSKASIAADEIANYAAPLAFTKSTKARNVTPAQVATARKMCEIVCVQNQYNLAHREDGALIDDLAAASIAYVPFFPLGGFSPLQSTTLTDVAARLGATPLQVALAWLLHRAQNILLIPGTSSVGHLEENLAARDLALSEETLAELDKVAKLGAGYERVSS